MSYDFESVATFSEKSRAQILNSILHVFVADKWSKNYIT